MRIAPGLSAVPPRRRGISLTPMIDVVFLLLVFFMLASRFGFEEALPLTVQSDGTQWKGPPRLIEIYPDATQLNGRPIAPDALARGLSPLMPAADSPVILRARGGADIGRVVAVMGALQADGFTRLVLME